VKRLAIAVLLGACGRLAFDPLGDPLDGAAGGDAIASTRYRDAVLGDAPIAYYRFDETGGMVASDHSGHGNDATYSAVDDTVVYSSPGALAGDPDRAVTLSGDGTGTGTAEALVRMPMTVDPWAGDFTVEVWVKPMSVNVAGNSDLIFVWEDYLVDGFRIGWSSNLTARVWNTEAGGTTTLESARVLVFGAWSHLVVTKLGSSMSIYLQGSLQTSTTFDYTAPPADADNCLGACHGALTDGIFDELAIYDRALTTAQIATHYAAGSMP
jgi:hypothetical protein